MDPVKKIAILGSTGSIGTQTLDIIAAHPNRFKVGLLTAANNYELLAQQAMLFMPEKVVIANPVHRQALARLLFGSGIRIEAGPEAIAQAAAEDNTDTVVTAMVGYSGLQPTISAIRSGKTIALANKETLVVAGEIVTALARAKGVDILPVDSEHSAIFQCLQGEQDNPVDKIILTASGGPFRKFSLSQLQSVTKADALRHPNWSMGAKVTIDSASMMNKGFEMIEARWLFGVAPADIEIVVHPQSIVHSMVQFADGAVKAQLGIPDMHTPISYAMSYPFRLPSSLPRMSLDQYASLTFERPDFEKFPLLSFAFQAIGKGGNMPCILNAANEIAVDAFLHDRIRFTDMPLLVRQTMDSIPFIPEIDLESLIITDREARAFAASILPHFQN